MKHHACRFSAALRFAHDIVRWRTWYDSKAPLFLVCIYYAAITADADALSVTGDMAVLFLLLCLYASFGYSVNSLSDRAVDTSVDKSNALAEIPDRAGKYLVGILAGASIAFVFYVFRGQPSVTVLFCLAFLTAAAYSLKPVRFKERGMLGLLAAAVAQRTFPAVIVFQAMHAWDWTALALCALSTAIGLRSIIVHQLKDEAADRRAKVRTVATTRGGPFLRRMLTHGVFPLELTALVAAVALMSTELAAAGIVFLGYGIWSVVQLLTPGGRRDKRFSRFSPKVLADWYYLYWPVLLAAGLVVHATAFLPVFVFTVVWVRRRVRNEARYAYRVVMAARLPPSPG